MFKRDKSRKLTEIKEELISKNVPDEKPFTEQGFIEEVVDVAKPLHHEISPCQAEALANIEVKYSSAIIFLLVIILIIIIIFFIVFIWWANNVK